MRVLILLLGSVLWGLVIFSIATGGYVLQHNRSVTGLASAIREGELFTVDELLLDKPESSHRSLLAQGILGLRGLLGLGSTPDWVRDVPSLVALLNGGALDEFSEKARKVHFPHTAELRALIDQLQSHRYELRIFRSDRDATLRRLDALKSLHVLVREELCDLFLFSTCLSNVGGKKSYATGLLRGLPSVQGLQGEKDKWEDLLNTLPVPPTELRPVNEIQSAVMLLQERVEGSETTKARLVESLQATITKIAEEEQGYHQIKSELLDLLSRTTESALVLQCDESCRQRIYNLISRRISMIPFTPQG